MTGLSTFSDGFLHTQISPQQIGNTPIRSNDARRATSSHPSPALCTLDNWCNRQIQEDPFIKFVMRQFPQVSSEFSRARAPSRLSWDQRRPGLPSFQFVFAPVQSHTHTHTHTVTNHTSVSSSLFSLRALLCYRVLSCSLLS